MMWERQASSETKNDSSKELAAAEKHRFLPVKERI